MLVRDGGIGEGGGEVVDLKCCGLDGDDNELGRVQRWNLEMRNNDILVGLRELNGVGRLIFALSAPYCNVRGMAAGQFHHSVLANVSLPSRYLMGDA